MIRCSVIGYGRFGRLAASILKRTFDVIVYDTKPVRISGRHVRAASLRECASAEIIVLAVPVRKLDRVLKQISPQIRKGTLVADVCAVKEYPVQRMKSLLPPGTEILGTHPLFGPDSYPARVHKNSIVIAPVSIGKRRLVCITKYLRSVGLEVTTMTPSAHDRLMSRTLLLTQLAGRACAPLLRTHEPVSTLNYRFLRHIAETSSADSIGLLRDLFGYNRFAGDVPDRLITEMKRLQKLIGC